MLEKMDNEQLFRLIKRSLWNIGTCEADWMLYEELKRHAIAALPAGILEQIKMTDELRQNWKMTIFQQIAYNINYRFFQADLPVSVPYAILKGTSAAKYYPHPEYRAMGDIDIITRKEDFTSACDSLLAAEFLECSDINNKRHRGFVKNGIVVEVHAHFASLNDQRQAQYLDNLIIDNFTSSHELPDLVNGLVILEHIYQHLENGLGLRQILDWMMFVDKCLPDEAWDAFYEHLQKTDLIKLAVVVTRMCEMYLGLSERRWCEEADRVLCDQLMDYVLICGNFGNKRTGDSNIVENVFVAARTAPELFKLLQQRGLVNWGAARKNKVLRGIAWLYQAGRYIIRGSFRENALMNIKNEYMGAKKRNGLVGSRKD